MTIKEIMERVGSTQTGRILAYIKDGLEELNIESETHVKTIRVDIEKDRRFYSMPYDMVKILDIRCKHHDNDDDLYQSIPRIAYEPETEDIDGL